MMCMSFDMKMYSLIYNIYETLQMHKLNTDTINLLKTYILDRNDVITNVFELMFRIIFKNLIMDPKNRDKQQ